MFYRLFGKQLLHVLHVTAIQRRAHKSIEQERSIDQKAKTDNLEEFERFPTEEEGDNPDEQGSACVDCGAGCCTDGAGYRETEEIESAEWY